VSSRRSTRLTGLIAENLMTGAVFQDLSEK